MAVVSTQVMGIHQLINAPEDETSVPEEFSVEQHKDPNLYELILYLITQSLHDDEKRARIVVAQSNSFTVLDGILYFPST